MSMRSDFSRGSAISGTGGSKKLQKPDASLRSSFQRAESENLQLDSSGKALNTALLDLASKYHRSDC